MTNTNTTATATVFENKAMYTMIINNAQKIGNKYFAFIPMEMLDFDMSYQRIGLVNGSRIRKLVRLWEENLCDAIQVSPHPEEGKFYVTNGYHRTQAGKEMGKDGMTCEIFMSLAPLAPEERRLAEAKLFAKQSDAIERLTAVQKHSANLILGKKENVLIHELCKKYHVNEKPNGTGSRSVFHNTLTAMTVALQIAKKDVNYLDDAFDIICSAGWNNGTNGFSDYVLSCLEWILEYHPDKKEEIKTELKKWFRTINPDIIQAKGIAKYPMRTHKRCAMTLEVEDHLHEVLGIPYTYTELTLAKLNRIA